MQSLTNKVLASSVEIPKRSIEEEKFIKEADEEDEEDVRLIQRKVLKKLPSIVKDKRLNRKGSCIIINITTKNNYGK